MELPTFHIACRALSDTRMSPLKMALLAESEAGFFPAEMATKYHVSPAGIGGSVDALEILGWVKRVRQDDDHRKVKILSTAKGRNHLQYVLRTATRLES